MCNRTGMSRTVRYLDAYFGDFGQILSGGSDCGSNGVHKSLSTNRYIEHICQPDISGDKTKHERYGRREVARYFRL